MRDLRARVCVSATVLLAPLAAALRPMHVDLHADLTRPVTLTSILTNLAPQWAERAGSFDCQALAGGLTNVVLRARPEASGCESLLVRVFGDNTERVLDREKELLTLQTLAANDAHFPTVGVVGTFTNGRVERFSPGRVLRVEELRLPAMARKIAKALARLHAVDVPGHERQPSLWRMLDRWLALALADGVPLPLGLDEAAIRDEIAQLRARVDALPTAPVVFSHNDASALNLIFDERKDSVALIDFVTIAASTPATRTA